MTDIFAFGHLLRSGLGGINFVFIFTPKLER